MTVTANVKLYNNLHIFTNECLRINDNPSLLNALDTSETLHTVYFTRFMKQNSTHLPVHRMKYILESLQCLQTQLEEFGIPLYIINEPSMATLFNLILGWGITRVTMEKQISYTKKKNNIVLVSFLASQGVKLVTELSSTFYDITKIQPNIKYEQFLKITDKMTPQLSVTNEKIRLLSRFRSICDSAVSTKLQDIRDFGVTDEKLARIDSKFKGGEFQAMEQLIKRFERQDKTIPDTTAFSPALNFGCISPRIIHDYIRTHSADPDIARKIYYGLKKRDYLLLVGGQCPNIDNQASIYNYILPWDENQYHVRSFEAGQTGFPIVDAIIAQLKKEGYVQTSHRAILAKFLTCGMLWLGWHHGVKLFCEWSLDYNPSICGLSWMQSACATWLRGETGIGDTNPIDEARALDPNGEYIKRYLPQLIGFPAEFVHTPWRAPHELQIEAGCIIGDSYPSPLYPETEARFLCCKERLSVFYSLIKTVHKKKALESLGKRKLECIS